MKTLLKIIILFTLLTLSLSVSLVKAAQSTIIEAEGQAAMGDDKSRKQTEEAAMQDAKRKASESAITYITSETTVKNYVLEKDLINAYTNATVKVLQIIEKGWFNDPQSGDCYRIKIKAEVIPDEKSLPETGKSNSSIIDDPTAPLLVKVWTDKNEYREGAKVKVYLKGNKPFYAKVIYKEAGGNLVQILPNPFRSINYFNGGVVYELPSGDDRYELEVSPPFGSESVIIYASTAQLGEIKVTDSGAGVYTVNSSLTDVEAGTRGITLKPKTNDNQPRNSIIAAEFTEAQANLKTGKNSEK